MPLSALKNKLEELGCEVTVDKLHITVSIEENEVAIEVTKEWEKALRLFQRSNQHEFETSKRKLVGPRSIEIVISKLNQEFTFGRPSYEFTSPKKRVVNMSQCTKIWALHFFDSDEYKDFFKRIVKRKLRRNRVSKIEDLLWTPTTIAFSIPRKTDKSKLLDEGIPAIEACLFKLAVEKGECWDLIKKRKRRLISLYDEDESDPLVIPMATYDENMLKYFKVAISSQFPSQSFLSFYHVLEYNFLSVSDESLHGRLKSHVHSTIFNGSHEQLEKLISIVKKHSDSSDETEMLSRVLRKYVDEDELIQFISEVEEAAEEKLYSKSRDVFGERFHVQTKRDHVISNVAKLLKHVRNALVHSSDRYNREDCHIPLTDSELIVEDYIPLVRFLAEKVIYAKSS